MLTVLFAVAGPVKASIITLSALDSGWYDADGTHEPTNTNYAAGLFESEEYRNFFAFNLPSVTGPIVGAEFRVDVQHYWSQEPNETYTLFDVSTPFPDLVAGGSVADGSERPDIFSDLGTGASYGSRVIAPSDAYTTISIGLNANALTALNTGPTFFSMGGALVTQGGSSSLFLVSGSNVLTRELVLTIGTPPPPHMPEPSTLFLFSAGALGIVIIGLKRRRQTAQVVEQKLGGEFANF